MQTNKKCPVCLAQRTSVIQQIYLQRQLKTVDQWKCDDCESFFHISGYKEDENQLRADTEFQLAHPGKYQKFVRKVRRIFPHAATCLEIGCGTGELLSFLERAGFQAEGIDVNPNGVRAAVNRGLSASAGYFKKADKKYDLIFAVDVLEHLENPRQVVEDAISMLNPNGGVAIRVPTVDRKEWKYLPNAPLKRIGFDFLDPFRDNSVHITHFSTPGLFKMMAGFGFKPVGVEYDIHIFAPFAFSIGTSEKLRTILSGLWPR